MSEKYKLTKSETETTVLFNDDEKQATCYTCNKSLIKKLDIYCEQFPETFTIKRQDDYSKTYYFPKRLIAIRKPRILTDEQKETMSLRGKSQMAKLHKIAE